MKWLKIFIYILILYGITRQSVYTSSAFEKNPDQRMVTLQNFFNQKRSPLASSSQTFIQIADKYKLDWRLLPSIAGVESGFETAGNIYDHNAWGYMCNGSPCYFKSYQDAIETVAKTISINRAYAQYRKSGSISDLAITYNSVSPEDWTNKLNYFMNKL